MTEHSHRCGGQCCRAFTLTIAKNAFASRIAAALRAVGTPEETRDDQMAIDWLPHVHELEGTPGTYRCDLLDDATGLCTVYATRPRTCRVYPGDEPTHTCSGCGFCVAPVTIPETTKAASDLG